VLAGAVALAFAVETPEECPDWDLDATAESALLLVSDAEFDRALSVTEDAIERLHCLDRVADPEALATLWQVRAAAGLYGGYPEIVESNLVQAAAVNPGWFEKDLGGALRERWVEAGRDPGEPSRITAWPIPDDAVLYVDGMLWPEQPALVHPGTHLVQVSLGAEVQYAKVVALAPEQQVNLDTGLAEPTSLRRLSPWLVGGIASAVAAGGTYAGAVAMSNQARATEDPASLDEAWRRAAVLGYVATPALGALAVTGVVLHFKRPSVDQKDEP